MAVTWISPAPRPSPSPQPRPPSYPRAPLPRTPPRPWPQAPRPLPFAPYTPTRAPFGARLPVPLVGPRPVGFPIGRMFGWMGLAFEFGWWLGGVFPWNREQPQRWQPPAGWIDHFECFPPVGGDGGMSWYVITAASIPDALKCQTFQVNGEDSMYANLVVVGPSYGPGNGRMTNREGWLYPYFSWPGEHWPAPELIPAVPPMVLAPPLINVPPYYDPTHLPIFAPVPTWRPGPLKSPAPDIWRAPGDPTPLPAPGVPAPAPAFWPAPPIEIPGPVQIPVRGNPNFPGVPVGPWIPGIEIPIRSPRPSPGGGPRPGTGPGTRPEPGSPPVPKPQAEWKPHYTMGPKKGEPERKIRSVRGAFAPLIWGIANGVTETTDVIDAICHRAP